jgi:hypothetical protein
MSGSAADERSVSGGTQTSAVGLFVAGGYDHHRDRRVLRAQVNQAGKARYSRHGQVEQDQVDIGILFQQRGEIIERSRFVDFRRGHDAGNRLPQRIAKQRMVIGDNESGAGRGHLFFLRRICENPAARFRAARGI